MDVTHNPFFLYPPLWKHNFVFWHKPSKVSSESLPKNKKSAPGSSVDNQKEYVVQNQLPSLSHLVNILKEILKVPIWFKAIVNQMTNCY